MTKMIAEKIVYEWIAFDDCTIRKALQSIKNAYKSWIREHQDNKGKEKDEEIQINRQMIRLLDKCLEQNKKVSRFFEQNN